MCKKILFILCLSTINISTYADDSATNFMLMNNYNVRQSPDIWSRMRSGFRLNPDETSRVKYYERFYTKNPATFNRFMKNAAPYLYYVLTEVERYGLPSELALIPIVESDYNSYAVNGTGRYDGIWQFVPSTGADFGLYENNNINDRRNIVKATNAAMVYLNYLDILFKQWDVAIGSYNWGPGNMYKAIVSSNQKVGNVNYNTLPLRTITANYVPKLVALANIIRDPDRFGIKLMNIPNQPYFAITHPVNNITVAEIDDISHTNEQTFKILNPHLKNSRYTLNNQSQVLLPIQNQNVYLASINKTNNVMLASAKNITNTQTATNVATSNSDNTTDQNNIVAVNYASDNSSNANTPTDTNDAINQVGYASEISGNDTDSNIKEAVNVTYKPIEPSDATVTTRNTVQAATSNHQPILIIPKQARETSPVATTAENDTKGNDQAIDRLVDNLRTNNRSYQPAKVVHTKFVKTASTRYIKYRVNKGDTLYSIARKFDVDIDEIKKTNKIHGNSVKTGQLLTIRTTKRSNTNA